MKWEAAREFWHVNEVIIGPEKSGGDRGVRSDKNDIANSYSKTKECPQEGGNDILTET